MSHDQTFHALHHAAQPLHLPNAWDAGTAALMQDLGAPAIATSSAAVCWSLGYADGNQMPFEELLGAVRRIARVLRVPFSVDAEMGYAEAPEAVAANVSQLMDAGAVGINIEDGRAAPEVLARKITAIRAAADRAGVKLFINARCDVYLKGLVPPEQQVEETLKRGALYRGAGASGLFIGNPKRESDIATVCASAGLPVNVLAEAGMAAGSTLARLGVKRISSGSGPAEWVYGQLGPLMQGFLADGAGQRFGPGARSWADLNRLLTPQHG